MNIVLLINGRIIQMPANKKLKKNHDENNEKYNWDLMQKSIWQQSTIKMVCEIDIQKPFFYLES